MKRSLVLAFCAAIIVGVGACTDATNPGASLSGTYTLRSANGSRLPVTVYQDATMREEVLDGRIYLDESGNYTDVVTYRDTYYNGTQSNVYDYQLNGYWSLTGDQLTLTDASDPGNPYYATMSQGDIIFQDYASGSGFTLVYSR